MDNFVQIRARQEFFYFGNFLKLKEARLDNMTLKTRWKVPFLIFVCILSHISYSDFLLFFALWTTLLFMCLYLMNPVWSLQNQIGRIYLLCDHRAYSTTEIAVMCTQYILLIIIYMNKGSDGNVLPCFCWQGPPHIKKVKQYKLCCPFRSVWLFSHGNQESLFA